MRKRRGYREVMVSSGTTAVRIIALRPEKAYAFLNGLGAFALLWSLGASKGPFDAPERSPPPVEEARGVLMSTCR